VVLASVVANGADGHRSLDSLSVGLAD